MKCSAMPLSEASLIYNWNKIRLRYRRVYLNNHSTCKFMREWDWITFNNVTWAIIYEHGVSGGVLISFETIATYVAVDAKAGYYMIKSK